MRLVLGIQRARAGITVRETRETFLVNFSSIIIDVELLMHV